MPRVEFEANTLDELVEMARRWVSAYPTAESLEAVVARITSNSSRQLLREAAERSLAGQALVIDGELLDRLGLEDRTSLVGVLGVINRTMRRRAHRDLLTADKVTHGYRMDPADARVVLGVLGTKGEDLG